MKYTSQLASNQNKCQFKEHMSKRLALFVGPHYTKFLKKESEKKEESKRKGSVMTQAIRSITT